MDAVQRALLQVELRRGGAPGDFVSFVLSCQQESPRAAHGQLSGRKRVFQAQLDAGWSI